MKPPSPRDAARLQRAILALYSHLDIDGFRRAVPGIFMDLIPADHFSLADIRLEPRRKYIRILNLWESPVLFVGKLLAAMEDNLYDHPLAVYARHHRVHGALRLSDFLTLAQLRKTRLYREALQPAKRGRLLSIGAFGGPGLSTLSLSRAETARDFTERDRDMLEMLRPHFEQARANLERETILRAGRSRSLKALGLTPRETEVALWLAQGKSNHEIGAILTAPARTIEKHVERILRKLGVENRSSAAIAVARIVRG